MRTEHGLPRIFSPRHKQEATAVRGLFYLIHESSQVARVVERECGPH